MKRAYVIHGWEGSERERLHVWVKSMLEGRGFAVDVPAMPEPSFPRIDAWLHKLNDVIQPADALLLVGHSIGAQAVLRYVEQMSFEPSDLTLLLIAPWMSLDEQTIREEGEDVVEMARPWIETPIDFERVRRRARRIFAVFSDNDPYVEVSQKQFFEQTLGARAIMLSGMGHVTDSDPRGYKDPIEELVFGGG